MDISKKDGENIDRGNAVSKCDPCGSEKSCPTLSDLVDFSNDYTSGLYYCLMKNYLMAKCCFERAAQNGDERAKRRLQSLKDEGLI